MRNYIHQFSQQLHRPFPNTTSKEKGILNILGVGLFISIFLYYFFGDTFELQGYSALSLSLQFGAFTVISGLLYEGFVAKVLKFDIRADAWTFLHWMIYMAGLLLLLAQVNYGLFLFHTQFTFELASFLEITQHTFAVGVLPVIFSGYVSQLKAERLKQRVSPSSEIEEAKPVVLHSKNQSQSLSLKIEDLLYVEALENYVFVYFIADENVQKELLRNTLKSMVLQLADTSMIRCHRSFIVNTARIEKVRGNSQGLKLSLSGPSSSEIPVSRKYISTIKAHTQACH